LEPLLVLSIKIKEKVENNFASFRKSGRSHRELGDSYENVSNRAVGDPYGNRCHIVNYNVVDPYANRYHIVKWLNETEIDVTLLTS